MARRYLCGPLAQRHDRSDQVWSFFLFGVVGSKWISTNILDQAILREEDIIVTFETLRIWYRQKGKNWLFFGDQHEAQDFLYRDEITAWQDSGLLTETSLAWSRDTDKKVYVQTHILEQGEQFYEWLEAGAYIYICGDASRMAADVDKAIRQVIATHSGQGFVGAEAYMTKLSDEHRYQRDVY